MELRLRAAGPLVIVVVLAGCGRSSGPSPTIEKTVPVSGVLTYNGAPLESYQVTFMPSDGRRPAVGVTDAQGRFTLGTNRDGDGAPPGQCKVSVVWVPPPSSEPGGTEQIIDDPALLPKPPVKIPDKYASHEKSGLTQDVPDSGLENLKIDLQ